MNLLHLIKFDNIDNHHMHNYANFNPKKKICSIISTILLNSVACKREEYIMVIMACKNDIKELIWIVKINSCYNGSVERMKRKEPSRKCINDIYTKIPYNFDDFVIKYDIDDIKKNINFNGEIKVYDINEIDKYDIEYNKNMNSNVAVNLSDIDELDSVD